jgi:hypothetical protein
MMRWRWLGSAALPLGCAIAACGGATVTLPPSEAAPTQAPTQASGRPSPPADLDARLVRHYPLRGFVLSESGFARVRFSVGTSGAVSTQAVLNASNPPYGEACRAMLEESTWTPARDARGQALPFSGDFSCTFEHPTDSAPRTTSEPARVTPPIAPDYGEHWYERFSEEIAARDASAALEVDVSTDGQVRVLGVAEGSQPAVAAACRSMLEQGPRWTPAKDAAGRPAPYRGRFSCRVEVDTDHIELALSAVGAAGPVTVETAAKALMGDLVALSHCFESAAGMDKWVHGTHWLAFVILPNGVVERVEWVERPLVDEVLDACLFGALRELRFTPAQERTIVDVQLELSGVQRLGFRL